MIKNIYSILIVLALCIPAGIVAQENNKLDISLTNGTLQELILSIERQSDYTFVYKDLDLSKKVTTNLKQKSLQEVLKQVFSNSDISYNITGKRIILTKGKPQTVDNQSDKKIGITGTIVDSEGVPLIGAAVMVKGSATNGTVTDVDGKFSITASPTDYLNFSYLGYRNQSVLIGNMKTIDVRMQEDNNFLDEIVVVGYGEQKKVNITGAITNVKSEELNKIPASNLSNTLAGRAAGATIVGSSGLIGATSSIRIRGGFGEPLYVIDGVIANKNSFDALDPTEIDQLSFLKDAATASVYGTAAGNGVVLVTTKQGNSNSPKPKFTYQGAYSFSNPTKELMTDRFKAKDELVYQNRVAEFEGRALPNGEQEFAYFDNRDYNIMDWIWQSPWNTKHTLTTSGGSENIQYYMLGGYMKEEGSFVNLKNDKYNLRSNVTAKLSSHIKMNLNISGHMKEGQRFYWPATNDDDYDVHDLYRSTFNVPRTYPFYVNEDGTPADKATPYPLYPNYGGWTGWNVVDQVIGNRYLKTREREINAILSFDFDLGFITKGLTSKVSGNYKSFDKKWKRYLTFQKNYGFQVAEGQTNRFVPGPINQNDYRIFNFNRTDEEIFYETQLRWSEQFNVFLNYANSFGKHAVSGTVVFEQASNGGEYTNVLAQDPLTEYDQWFVFSTDPTKRRANAGEYTGGRLSWIGRLNYIFDQKYITEFSFRYDGSDKFAKNKRWGFFPSASLAWRVSQENFMEDTRNWLSDLKLRFSYGTTGNNLDVNGNELGQFNYLQRYIAGDSYLYGNDTYKGIKPSAIPSPNLTWATSRTYNGGLDFGFIGQRLNGTIDAFYRKETNILGSRISTLPTTYGRELAPENYAERSWRGAEISLNWSDRVANGAIDYAVYANVGYAKDQWDVLDESASYTSGNLQDLSRAGMAHDRQIGYIAKGIIRTQEQLNELLDAGFTQWGRKPYLGAILYEDTRGDGYSKGADGKIDGNDYYNLLTDNGAPRVNYGFGGDISYKGFTLSAHFQGVGNYDRFIGGVEGGFAQWGGTLRPYYPIWATGDVWTAENPDAKYPRVVGQTWFEAGAGSGDPNNPTHTTFWKRNGAYLRLKNLNIGYKLPKKILSHIGLTEAQVFMNSTNLFYISSVGEFHDPEQKNADSYPNMRSFTFGLNLSF